MDPKALDDEKEIKTCTDRKNFAFPICTFLRNNLLLIATLVCVFLGVFIGIMCRPLELSAETIQYVGFPGEIFMRIFKMLLIPLIVSSMVTGLGNLKGRSKGKLGLCTMIYYICTTCVAITTGIIVVVTIRPGEVTDASSDTFMKDNRPLPSALDTSLDLIRNLFPPNIVQAAVQHSRTVFTRTDSGRDNDIPDATPSCSNISIGSLSDPILTEKNMTCDTIHNSDTGQWRKDVQFKNGLNVTGILLFFAVFGILLNKMGEGGRLMLEFFNILNEIVLTMTKLAMWYCPIGIMFIIINKILTVPDLARAAQQLGMYMLTGLTGLAFHSLIVLPSVYYILTRKNPFRVSLHLLQATVIALGTSSSSATLPVTLHCCENKLKFDKNICRFIVPIGATINMDGLAIIQAITPIFIAQMNDKTMMFGDILTISLSATLASIGAAGVPGTGFITMLAVVVAAGLPAEDAYIVLSVDWFMMRMGTMVNVYGDALAAGVFTHFFSKSQTSSMLLPHLQLRDVRE